VGSEIHPHTALANAPYPFNNSSGTIDGYGCWQYDDFGNRTQEAYSTTYSNPCSSESYANAQWTVTTPCVPPIYNPHNTSRILSIAAVAMGGNRS